MKTSIVYATVKLVVQHKDDECPEEVVSCCNYDFAIEPDEGQSTPKIVSTEIMESEDRGECHPTEHYLLEEHRRDVKNGLYGDD